MTDYSILKDEELVTLLKKGDQQAFAQIYQRYWAVLFQHTKRMLQDEDEAEDVLQEVFLILWNKSPHIEFKTSLSGYLYTTVRNRVFDHMDHEKVKAKYITSLGKFIESENYEADFLIREQQLKALIEQEISALPPRMKQVFELSRKTNLSYKEIAERLGVSELTVRNQISRALKILHSKFGAIIFIYLFLDS